MLKQTNAYLSTNPPFIQIQTSHVRFLAERFFSHFLLAPSSPTCPFFSYLPLHEMLIQPIPITPTSSTFTSTTFTPAFTPTTFIGSPTALIAIARTSRDGDGCRYRDMDRDMDRDVVVPQPIELPRLLAFEDRMEVDDDDVFHDDHNEAVHDAVDVDSSDSDSDSDSDSTTSTTSRISDISSMTSVTSVSSSSSIAKSSPAAAAVYIPPHKHSFTKSASEPESDFDSGGSIPSHRLLSHSRSHSQHSSKSQPNPNPKSQSKSQSKSSTHVNRYKYQGGETGVMTGGVMLGSAIRSPFTPTRSPFTPLASTRSRSPLARPTKRGTARTLILGPDSSSLDWRRPRVPGVPVA
ncbi:hypothetical protein GG344DRAFT_67504 [Lentinula edodes]|nr:hypothetical protein GG344DRAFT_67504 [Lentinula edodes]